MYMYPWDATISNICFCIITVVHIQPFGLQTVGRKSEVGVLEPRPRRVAQDSRHRPISTARVGRSETLTLHLPPSSSAVLAAGGSGCLCLHLPLAPPPSLALAGCTAVAMNGLSTTSHYAEQLEGFRKSDADRDALVAQVIRDYEQLKVAYRHEHGIGMGAIADTSHRSPTRRSAMTSATRLRLDASGRVCVPGKERPRGCMEFATVNSCFDHAACLPPFTVASANNIAHNS